MSTLWDTRFNQHVLWPLVEQVKDQLKDVATPNDVDLAASLSRLQWLISTLESHRGHEDARRYSVAMLENVHRVLSANVHAPLEPHPKALSGPAPMP